nr:MAG TPA: hypothetical protein [Caudoviricetes sp.]
MTINLLYDIITISTIRRLILFITLVNFIYTM